MKKNYLFAVLKITLFMILIGLADALLASVFSFAGYTDTLSALCFRVTLILVLHIALVRYFIHRHTLEEASVGAICSWLLLNALMMVVYRVVIYYLFVFTKSDVLGMYPYFSSFTNFGGADTISTLLQLFMGNRSLSFFTIIMPLELICYPIASWFLKRRHNNQLYMGESM